VKARVLIRLKAGILDVQGAAVQRALNGLGFGDLRELDRKSTRLNSSHR